MLLAYHSRLVAMHYLWQREAISVSGGVGGCPGVRKLPVGALQLYRGHGWKSSELGAALEGYSSEFV